MKSVFTLSMEKEICREESGCLVCHENGLGNEIKKNLAGTTENRERNDPEEKKGEFQEERRQEELRYLCSQR